MNMNYGGSLSLKIYGKERTLITREFIRGQEKMNFCPFDEGDIISLEFGGRFNGLPITAGVYKAGREKGMYYLQALPILERNRAVALFRMHAINGHRLPSGYHEWVEHPAGWQKCEMSIHVKDLGRV